MDLRRGELYAGFAGLISRIRLAPRRSIAAWDSGGTLCNLAYNWKCRVTDMTTSADWLSRRVVVNLGVLVSGRMLYGCYSTFAFLWPLGGERILNFTV